MKEIVMAGLLGLVFGAGGYALWSFVYYISRLPGWWCVNVAVLYIFVIFYPLVWDGSTMSLSLLLSDWMFCMSLVVSETFFITVIGVG